MVNAKKALMKLWNDELSVIEHRPITKPNGAKGYEEVVVLSEQKCKLSFSTLKEANQDGAKAAITQVTKIFCDNALVIKAGSKIVVKQKSTGRTLEYSQSGEPGTFTNHQEIILVPFRGWA